MNDGIISTAMDRGVILLSMGESKFEERVQQWKGRQTLVGLFGDLCRVDSSLGTNHDDFLFCFFVFFFTFTEPSTFVRVGGSVNS